MQIERHSAWTPITIRIETEQEAWALRAIANYTPLYKFLKAHGINSDHLRDCLHDQQNEEMHTELVRVVEEHVKNYGSK